MCTPQATMNWLVPDLNRKTPDEPELVIFMVSRPSAESTAQSTPDWAVRSTIVKRFGGKRLWRTLIVIV